MFNLEQLRMFVVSVETGSFSACARKLGKVQSAVSQGISNLEVDLNIELFDRTTRKPKLTEEGSRLLIYARSVLQQIEEMHGVAQAIDQGEELHIRFALEDALLVPKLSVVLQEFREQFKATTLEFISATSPDIKEMIKSDRADIGLQFLTMEIEKGVEQCYIGNIPFHAVCRPDHALADLEVISLQELVPHKQLTIRSEIGNYIEHFPPISNELWTATNFHLLLELTLQGAGWSYLPCHLVDHQIREGRLHRLMMSFDHKSWSPPVELIIPKNKTMNPALCWLSEKIKKVLD